MAKKMEVYKCELCGNMTEGLHDGAGTMVCCGQNMTVITENTTEAAKEKHIPVVEKTADGYKVKVGSVAHPMDEKHYIEWIELIAGNKVYRQYLKPGETPEASFAVSADQVKARAYCNLHGLWSN